MPSQQPIPLTTHIQGEFTILTSDLANVGISDFNFYDLVVQYQRSDPEGARQPMSVYFPWNTKTNDDITEKNTLHFSFDPINSNSVASPINVAVKGYDGTVLWEREFAKGDNTLQSLRIKVPLKRPEIVHSPDQGAVKNDSRRLRGKVIELSGDCKLKGAVVLVQARRQGDNALQVVGSATTDNAGNFSMDYPYGVFIAARAIVSLAPDSPVDIIIHNDPGHIATGQTIADDFLYLLVKNTDCVPEKDEAGCDCHQPKKVPRLPGHEELLCSNDYTQDLGGACVNLSTPNRTLNEYTQTAIVRITDPEVATYVLTRVENKDNVIFNLIPGNTPVQRKKVDLANPICWQDVPGDHQNLSICQAVEVATGHILHYKLVMKSDGYSMGELLYSLPLAPGQKKEIVVVDQTHILQASETQTISQKESLASSFVNDTSITDNLAGRMTESARGRSSATTGGFSGGFGLGAILDGVGISLGFSGGAANSHSSASQTNTRAIAESFAEKLRNSITQNAQSYRELNASVVTTVQEGFRYGVTSEVVANHNHCHSLTMMYFEVLRHYAIYQELSSVEECLFIPLLMTHFTVENIYKWRDILAANLLPMPSDTYLQPFNEVRTGLDNPVRRAFDALERVHNNWALVNFPPGAYDEELINSITGEMYIRTNLVRPKSRYDRIRSLPKGSFANDFFGGIRAYLAYANDVQLDQYVSIDSNYASVAPRDCIRVIRFDDHFFGDDILDKELWWAYASLLNFGGTDRIADMLSVYFSGKLISEWDGIFNNEIAPALFENIINKLAIVLLPGVTPVTSADFSSDRKYTGGEMIMKVSLRATPDHITRREISSILISNHWGQGQLPGELITLVLRNMTIQYKTAYSDGILFSGYVNDDLVDLTTIFTPESESERRNPRREDRFLTNKLIDHLNSHFEYYNKLLFTDLDPDRRLMLLDRYNIQTFDDYGQPYELRSLASVVKNELIGIAGNSLVMPVAPGHRIDRSYIVAPQIEGPVERIDLFDRYRPLTPVPPYRISIPTRGVYAEAVMGQCDACEKEVEKTSQDWTKFTTDEPTPINPITTPVPTITDWKAAFKELAAPVVNIQNAPAAPAPGAGLAGLTELLGKAGIFKDITGLDANQQNAMQTYLSNQENAKAFAEMAKELAMMGHNTEHSDKIMDTMKSAKDNRAITQDDYNQLVKDHLQQQIDGGQSKKVEQKQQQESKNALNDAAVDAIRNGQAVKAVSSASDGSALSVDVSAAAGPGFGTGPLNNKLKRFTLSLIDCGVQEDITGKDDCRLDITVDGIPQLSLRQRLESPKLWVIETDYFFRSEISFRMFEEDALDPDDLLGELKVNAVTKPETLAFFHNSDARYTMVYTVTEVPDDEKDKEIWELTLKSFEASKNVIPIIWSKVDKAALIADLKGILQTPYKVNALKSPLCGPACLVFELANRDKSRLVQLCRILYEYGQVNLPSGGATISDDLKASEIGFGMSPANWVLLAGLRDCENIFFSAPTDDSISSDISGITMPYELKGWVRELLGLDDADWTSTFVYGEVAALKECDTKVAAGGCAFLFIDSALLHDDQTRTVYAPNHWVVYSDGSLDLSEPGLVKFGCYSEGATQQVSVTIDRFEDTFWGIITA